MGGTAGKGILVGTKWWYSRLLLMVHLNYGWRLPVGIGCNLLLFLLPHLTVDSWWLAIVPVTISGFLMCYLYLATGSIWSAIGYHFAGNITFGMANQGLLLEAQGIEENLLALAIIQLFVYAPAALLLLWWYRRRVHSVIGSSPAAQEFA